MQSQLIANGVAAQLHVWGIGIYGCSAGGVLTAEAAATFQKEGLPRPGAIGMFCGAAVSSYGGDSSRVGIALTGVAPGAHQRSLYFNDADFKNPLAFPALDDAVMAQFPPSLLITGTRDQAMSAVVVTHTQLARLGVKADLYVWEGLGHAFFFDPDLPESREVYDVVTRFFQDHLAR